VGEVRKPRDDGGPFAVYRARIVYALAGVAVLFFLPFSVNNFFQNRVWLGIGCMLLVLVLASNAWSSFRKTRAWLPLWLIIVPAIPTLWLATRQQGFAPLLWCYPTLLLFHFILSRRMAIALSVILVGALAPAAWEVAGKETAIRFFATIVCTAVVSNVLVGIIGELQDKLVRQAIVDPLTGAFNRRHMEERLGEAIERFGRTKSPASLLLIDIDHFKRINDEHGHAMGDHVLQGVVAIIQRRIRKLDSLFRMGGEEFVVLLPDTREDQAATLAEHLRAAVEEATLLEGRRVSVSIGVSELRPGDTPLDPWLKRADDAMYRAKKTGRNSVITAAAMEAKPPRAGTGS
jgi:diguanylate cyclase (GGDEF)-like protein